MSRVRIWISYSCPLGPKTVVWSDWSLFDLGLVIFEREVLKLRFHARHAEPVCQRRVQFARFQRDTLALLRRQRIEGAHVVQPVGELDDDDAGVARDRHQQLAIVLRLFFGSRTEVQRGDLREAVDQISDFVAEVPPQHVQGDVGVLDDVVQQGRRDRRRIHLLLGQNRRDGHAVRHEVGPRQTLLPLVRLRADPVGARQDVEVEAVVLRRDGLRELRRENGPCPRAGCCAGGFRPHARRARHNSPASAKLTYRSPPPPPITTWSYTGTSSRRPASTNCRGTARSSAEGVGSPLGWLCTTMIPAAASAIAARNTSRGCTSELFRMPRVISRSARIWLWLPKASTWNSSTVRSRSRAPKKRCTSAGPRIRSGAGSASALTRRPSSSAAATRPALVRPTPGTRASSADGRPASRRSDPSTRLSRSPATVRASRPAHPVPRTRARSSWPVNAAAPNAHKRSRGRSCSGCSASRRGTRPSYRPLAEYAYPQKT